mmetsp:Transcript_101414/g.322228  ORF Transcript_101414/g.322228 Transcript_101414/m.322228 type:complete len:332 (-) Transcript_101414:210-1205(-)
MLELALHGAPAARVQRQRRPDVLVRRREVLPLLVQEGAALEGHPLGRPAEDRGRRLAQPAGSAAGRERPLPVAPEGLARVGRRGVDGAQGRRDSRHRPRVCAAPHGLAGRFCEGRRERRVPGAAAAGVQCQLPRDLLVPGRRAPALLVREGVEVEGLRLQPPEEAPGGVLRGLRGGAPEGRHPLALAPKGLARVVREGLGLQARRGSRRRQARRGLATDRHSAGVQEDRHEREVPGVPRCRLLRQRPRDLSLDGPRAYYLLVQEGVPVEGVLQQSPAEDPLRRLSRLLGSAAGRRHPLARPREGLARVVRQEVVLPPECWRLWHWDCEEGS